MTPLTRAEREQMSVLAQGDLARYEATVQALEARVAELERELKDEAEHAGNLRRQALNRQDLGHTHGDD